MGPLAQGRHLFKQRVPSSSLGDMENTNYIVECILLYVSKKYYNNIGGNIKKCEALLERNGTIE